MVIQQPSETREAYIDRLSRQLAQYEAKPGRHYGAEATRIRRELIKLSQTARQ
jgi:hypothetical protein